MNDELQFANVKLDEQTMTKTIAYLVIQVSNLQKENERLKNGYCELKVKCNNGECDCTNEEYDSMVKANMKGSLLLDDYKSRNEKAIEFVKKESKKCYTNQPSENPLKVIGNFMWHTDVLLKILQGEDKK